MHIGKKGTKQSGLTNFLSLKSGGNSSTVNTGELNMNDDQERLI